MTREAAIKVMEEGKKVTHRYFSHDEYISMIDGVVVDEFGYQHKNFWTWHSGKHFDNDWRIWED